ncbi:MAG: DUF4157 domain-containing protein [Proteobacteria bacterium]|nr:DUF4157 domain-containing protein [Pseudomonadota bacterium]
MRREYQYVRKPDRPLARRSAAKPRPISAASLGSKAVQRAQQGAGNAAVAEAALAAGPEAEDTDTLPSPAALYERTRLALQRRPDAEEPGHPSVASAYDSIIFLANRPNTKSAVETPSLAASGGLHVQTKLQVSEPGDEYEREADQVADAVMRMPAPPPQEGDGDGGEEELVEPAMSSPGIMRMCEECDEERELNATTENAIMAQAAPGRAHTPSAAADAAIQELQGRGQPLPASERAFFEPRFGVDFGHVRVHADARGDRAARSMNARAFTMGSDVVFRTGEYGPGNKGGRELLAHELTHVVQQNGGLTRRGREPGPGRSTPNTRTGERLLTHTLTHVVQPDRARAAQIVQRAPDDADRRFFIRVLFRFAELGIPKDTPGPELHIRFLISRGLTREQAIEHIAGPDAEFRDSWNEVAQKHRDSGVIPVRLYVSARTLLEYELSPEGAESVLPSGRTERHDARAREFKRLPGETKKAINAETDRRYWKKTGLTDEAIRKGEKGKAEAWLRIRDQVLAEREFLQYLPERVKRFMRVTGGKKAEITPKDYPQLIRIAKLIMGMSDEEVNDFLSAATGTTDDLNKFEQMLEAFVATARKGAGGASGKGEAGEAKGASGKGEAGEAKGASGKGEAGEAKGASGKGEAGEAKGGSGEGRRGADEGDKKKGSKYGRFGLIDLPQEIITVLETAAEILGDPQELTDLLDLLDEITNLQNITADVVNVLGDPENLLLLGLGILDNPAVAALDTWIFKPDKKAKKGAKPGKKKKGIKGLLQKVRRALPIVKKILKPVFLGRRKSMTVQFRASLLIDELPAAATAVLEKIATGSDKKKITAEVATLSETIVKKITTDLQEVPKALSQIEATEKLELINKEELGRIVAKLTVKLAGGIYGKAASKVGLDDVIADIAKHGTKYTIPDAVVDGINDNLNKIFTQFKPLVAKAGAEAMEVLQGIDKVLEKHLTPELNKLVSPRAKSSGKARLPGSEAGFWSSVAASSGTPMSRELHSRLHPLLGPGSDSVNIHTDRPAQEASQSIAADAFTIGRDVYFGPGQFDDRSIDGLGLIAHEVTHVVQHTQGGSVDTIHRRKTKKSIRQQLAKRLVGRILRGTGKTKRSIRGPSFIDYGSFDGQGRPTGIIARLKAPLKKGSPAKPSIRPPGFKGLAGGHARCHLLGDQLGGSGSEPRNLVACHQALNNTDMKSVENAVKKAVLAGETILYKVIPIYKRKGKLPHKIRMIAKGDGSPAFNFDKTFTNRK